MTSISHRYSYSPKLVIISYILDFMPSHFISMERMLMLPPRSFNELILSAIGVHYSFSAPEPVIPPGKLAQIDPSCVDVP